MDNLVNENKKQVNKQSFIKWERLHVVLFLVLFVILIFSSFYILSIKGTIPIQPKEFLSTDYLSKIKKPTLVIDLEDLDLQVKYFYPVAVMIDNFYESRPAAGLSQANFIYETLVEGGATRLMAIFDSNKDIKVIGPVRSARPYFVNWALEYDAFYAHAGGSPESLKNIVEWNVNNLNEISGYGPIYFYRNKALPAPHNLFTSTSRLSSALDEWGLVEPDYERWSFAAGTSSDQIAEIKNTKVYIDFTDGIAYDASFIYNSELRQYIRQDFDSPMRDPNNNKLVGVDNLILQFIPDEVYLDKIGRLELDIYGTGKALIFKNGEVEDIKWEKENLKQRTKFLYESGEEISLKPGLTWIVVVPGDREVTY